MITLSMIIAISVLFFVLGMVCKVIGGIIKICLWPVKAILGFVFSLIGIILIATFGAVFILPILLFIIGWIVSKSLCLL